MAAGLSGAIGAAIANPTDLIKVRAQAAVNSNKGLMTYLTEILQKEGFKGLYRGVGPNTQRAIVLTGSQLPSYDTAKHFLLSAGYFEEGILAHAVCSMIAGLVAATATSPIV